MYGQFTTLVQNSLLLHASGLDDVTGIVVDRLPKDVVGHVGDYDDKNKEDQQDTKDYPHWTWEAAGAPPASRTPLLLGRTSHGPSPSES